MKARIIAGVTAAAVAATTAIAVSASGETYSKDYTIANVLSDYQYFVSGDLDITAGAAHTVGAVAVGGNGYLGCWGDGQVAPSYVNNIANYINMNGGSYFTGSETYKNIDLYYNSKADGINIWPSQSCNPVETDTAYIDFTSAMSALNSQSLSLAQNGLTVAGSDYEASSKTITVDIADYTENKSIVIPYTLLENADKINFIDSTNANFGIADIATGEYTVSFVGVNATDIVLDFGGGFYSQTAKKVEIDINGQSFANNNSFKNLSGGISSSQVNLEGMNLVYNFPDATGNITTNYLAGHLVATKATVNANGGNFEGGIIAKSAVGGGEAHFYPYYAPGTAPDSSSDIDSSSESESSSTTDTSSVADSSSNTDSSETDSSSVADSSSNTDSSETDSSSIADSSSNTDSSETDSSSVADSSSNTDSSETDSSSVADSSSNTDSSEADSSSVADSSSNTDSSEADSSSVADSSSNTDSSETDSSSVADSSSNTDSSETDSSSVADSSSNTDSSETDSSSIADSSSETDSSSVADSSSNTDSSETDSSSIADSSSNTDSSETDSSSIADSSSNTDSSETDSSSVADSSSNTDSSSKDDSLGNGGGNKSSSVTDSSSKSGTGTTNTSKSTDNAGSNKSPNTGMNGYSAITAAALLTAAAAFVVGKKNK